MLSFIQAPYVQRVDGTGTAERLDLEDGTVWIAELSNLAAPRKATAGRDHYPTWSADGNQIDSRGTNRTTFFSFNE
jgi:hypothetical protein